MSSFSKNARINQIISILRASNGASIKHLSKELGVTEMTIRRDLETMRVNNIVTLVHGAAIYNPEAEKADEDTTYHVINETGVMDQEKSLIGKAAAKLVNPGDVIFVDTGSTTVHLVQHLPIGLSITLTCFTMNSLLAAYKKNVEHLVFAGGYYHFNTQMFESPEAIQMIHKMRASKAFISAAGIDRVLGLTCANQYEVDTKLACIENASQKILMVDSSKFGAIKPAYFGKLSQMDLIITDSGLSGEWKETLKKMNIPVILA